MRHALDQGVNLIDTAPGYGDSETRLGHALDGVSRDRYFLSTKFQPHASNDHLYTAQDMRKSLEESLKRGLESWSRAMGCATSAWCTEPTQVSILRAASRSARGSRLDLARVARQPRAGPRNVARTGRPEAGSAPARFLFES